MNEDPFWQIYEKDRQEWEPRDESSWPNTDPLLKAYRRNDWLDPDIERQVSSFHQGWIRLPGSMRSQVLREREIAAALVESLPALREIVPGLYSVGVGMRGSGQPELTAIMNVDEWLGSSEWYEVRERWAQYEIVPTRVPTFMKANLAPITVERRPTPTLLGKVPSNEFILGEPEPTPWDAPVLRSGDKIGSESPSGIREFGTLSCLVHKPSSTTPLLLASGHVLRKENWKVVSGRTVTARAVGNVKTVDLDMDVALAELSSPYFCDFRIQSPDLVPASPVIATSDMPVQMFGALSGYQCGFLNQGVQIPANSKAAGVFPMFTAQINCVHGDSGALLVTGFGTQPAVPLWQRRLMSPSYLDAVTCAILGVLKAGPPPDADPSLRRQGYFVPMLSVLSELGVEAWVR